MLEENSRDFYSVLGLSRNCTDSELKNAYRKLAMRWHPDRCCAMGNEKSMEESKKKFQTIQEAYSVLSDANKRFLYDLGISDNQEEVNGMSDFLGEMANVMRETMDEGNGPETFDDLRKMFDEMFERETTYWCNNDFTNHKQNFYDIQSEKTNGDSFFDSSRFVSNQNFYFEAEDKKTQGNRYGRKNNRMKQRVPSGNNPRSRHTKVRA